MLSLVLLALVPCVAMADECPSLKQCEAPIRTTNMFAESDAIVPDLTGVEVLDDVCSKLPALKTCISTKKDLCSSNKEKLKAMIFKDIIDYMCTTEGRKVTLDLDKSPCKDDPMVGAKFETLMTGCLGEFATGLKDKFESKKMPLTNAERCPFIIELDKCVVDDTKKMCGVEMATFVDKIWEIATAEGFKDYDCAVTHEHKRRYLETAMPIIKRSRLF
ncbi:hypothetical protein EGW08_018592 [Elysia chlorotica]|uniref:DUF19 domain-containing protein n=1 Tax=Elysia chlorotica TaxID=188477 RepID=A0A433SWG2_ELYCH|nr:hypothetical protein EGW08_018592 [Elysia chlorotica]